MRFSQRLILLVTLASPTALHADPQPASQLAEVLAFYEKNVHFRVIEVPLQTTTIADGRVSVDFKREQTFTNLVKLTNGFQFDVISVIAQTNYDLDAQGRRVLPGRDESRTLVARYAVQAMKSTGGVLGSCRTISSTLPDPLTGVGFCAFGLRIEDGKLVQDSLPVAYGDHFDRGGTAYPGTSRSRREFSVGADGKLTTRLTSETYRVDPVTFALSLIGPGSPIIDHEVRRLR